MWTFCGERQFTLDCPHTDSLCLTRLAIRPQSQLVANSQGMQRPKSCHFKAGNLHNDIDNIAES